MVKINGKKELEAFCPTSLRESYVIDRTIGHLIVCMKKKLSPNLKLKNPYKISKKGLHLLYFA